MIIDTHCHLDYMVCDAQLNPSSIASLDYVRAIMHDCAHNFVTTCITVGTTAETSAYGVFYAEKIPSVFCSVGIHPSDSAHWQTEISTIKKLLKETRPGIIVAIGEIGLDFYHPGFNKQRQHDALRAQIEVAIEYKLPVILHSRNAIDETLAVMDEYRQDTHFRGVQHCFSETPEVAREIVARNFYIGIGGAVTYPKNTVLRQVVQEIPLERLLLETDAPFLPPQVIRGKKNHPLHTATVGRFIANLLDVDFEELAKKTTGNAKNIFVLEKQA